MDAEEARPKRLRDDPSAREELRERLDRYLNVPLALASLALVLLAVIELTGEVSGPWRGGLPAFGWGLLKLVFFGVVVKFPLAPVKRPHLLPRLPGPLVVVLPLFWFPVPA